MNEATNPLDALRGIHEPVTISWWPPALGWWILLVLIVAIVVLFLWWRKHTRLRRAALVELAVLSKLSISDAQWLAQLNILLRRVAIAFYPKQEVAALTNDAWLRFLDKHGKTKKFTQGVGKVLAVGPYEKHCEIDRDALSKLSYRWIKSAARKSS